MCDFINAHEDLIKISTFGEYRIVMRNVSKVIKEAHNRERKRRQTARKEKCDEIKTRTQQAKSLIANIKRGGMRREEIVERLERIFGKGSGQEIETINSNEKKVKRIEELSKRRVV